jgi:hypothetical protein
MGMGSIVTFYSYKGGVGRTMALANIAILQAGNDIFIVWNRAWQRLLLRPGDLNLIPEQEPLAVKIRWTFPK